MAAAICTCRIGPGLLTQRSLTTAEGDWLSASESTTSRVGEMVIVAVSEGCSSGGPLGGGAPQSCAWAVDEAARKASNSGKMRRTANSIDGLWRFATAAFCEWRDQILIHTSFLTTGGAR